MTTLKTITLTTTPGQYSVYVPGGFFLTFFATLMEVKREGKGYDIVNTTPGNRQVRYNSIMRRLSFAVPFEEGETVFIIMKFKSL